MCIITQTLARWEVGAEEEVVPQLNTGSNIEVNKPQKFNGKVRKVSDFLTTYKLHIRMRMRDIATKK